MNEMSVQDDDSEELEVIIDRHGLKKVLVMMSDIAYAKADHIRETWEDKGLAQEWERDASKLDNLASKIRT